MPKKPPRMGVRKSTGQKIDRTNPETYAEKGRWLRPKKKSRIALSLKYVTDERPKKRERRSGR